MPRLSLLYDDMFSALYESVARRSYGSELDGFLGAALGLSVAMDFWLWNFLLLAGQVGVPFGVLGSRPALYFMFGVPYLFNLGYFVRRGRQKKAVSRFRSLPAHYRRSVAILAWTYTLLPLISLLSISAILTLVT